MLQFLLKLICTDVCAPNNLSVLTYFVRDALANHTGRRHWLTSTLAKWVELCISVWVKSWCAKHSVNIHKPASFLEVRHHGWSLEHTEKFSEFWWWFLTCVRVLKCDLLRVVVLLC